MYEIRWDSETGGIQLGASKEDGVRNEIRPVFFEELDVLGFDRYWKYERVEAPLLWAIGGRKYYYKGELIAEVEGGGLFTSPNIKVHKTSLQLHPVDMQETLNRNNTLLQGLVQQSLSFICQTYERFKAKVDVSAVAFSGGKDSLVLLDLVQRALDPDKFSVVFGDTGMEIQDTYKAVKAAQERWPHLAFYTAKSHKDAKSSWKEMGPPSRIHRWCCAVHKSAPTLLLLRKLTGKASVKALIFDGIRNDESASRASYLSVTQGGKHKMQTNVSPIISWNSGEVFLYLLSRNLLLNHAYRNGITRVGCSICPMSSQWKDMLCSMVYKSDTNGLIEELRNYATSTGIKDEDVNRYLEDGGWKSRAGGRYLENGGNRVIEESSGKKTIFTIRHASEDWLEWAKTLGKVVRTGEGEGFIERNKIFYPYVVTKIDSNIIVEIDNLAYSDRYTLSAFRSVALKTAYCNHCQACQVECPIGALDTHKVVKIADTCISCGICLDMNGKACLTAKSLIVSQGGLNMNDSKHKSLQSYQTFGLQKSWVAEFFRSPEEWASRNSLGNRQFDAMILWLKHSEIIKGDKNSIKLTETGKELVRLGADSPITWGVIWTNLVRNSSPVQWYATAIPWGSTITKADLVIKVGEEYPQSERGRENAMSALIGLLTKTPLGNELGLGEEINPGKRTVGSIFKRGWSEPESSVILYSLYRYAEKLGRYEFTVGELFADASEGPYVLFGVGEDKLKGILQGLSARGDGLVRTNIVRDLDNVFLSDIHKAIDVIRID